MHTNIQSSLKRLSSANKYRARDQLKHCSISPFFYHFTINVNIVRMKNRTLYIYVVIAI